MEATATLGHLCTAGEQEVEVKYMDKITCALLWCR